MLWGGHAQSKLPLIEAGKNAFILQSSHPSGLGVYKTDKPFLEPGGTGSCQHFTQTNQWLMAHNLEPIQWVSPLKKSADTSSQKDLFG
jgi:uracil-DNA glycosylase